MLNIQIPESIILAGISLQEQNTASNTQKATKTSIELTAGAE